MPKFYYIDERTKQQRGPVPVKEMMNHNIRPDTMVWRTGMSGWQNAETVAELAFLFNKDIPAPQPQPANRPPAYNAQPNNNQQTAGRQPQYNVNNQASNQAGDFADYQRWNGIIPLPKTWLVESILLSIFCCSPVSVVGIVYASRVESLYYKQDFEGAMYASKRAKTWALSGILFLPALYLVFFLLGMIAVILGL